MNRFFVDEKSENEIFSLSGDNLKHIKDVLKMREGELIEVCFNKECYICKIESVSKSEILASIQSKIKDSAELSTKINIFQGLPKKDKLELVIQKCTELGVNAIYPTDMERSIVKYDSKKIKNKMSRWQKIALSASMQSKREKIVEVHYPKSLKEFEEELKNCDLLLVLYEKNNDYTSFKSLLSIIKKYDTINVVIGPEGGISEEEIEYLYFIGAKTISLGRRILRTETAGLAFLSCASVFLEE